MGEVPAPTGSVFTSHTVSGNFSGADENEGRGLTNLNGFDNDRPYPDVVGLRLDWKPKAGAGNEVAIPVALEAVIGDIPARMAPLRFRNGAGEAWPHDKFGIHLPVANFGVEYEAFRLLIGHDWSPFGIETPYLKSTPVRGDGAAAETALLSNSSSFDRLPFCWLDVVKIGGVADPVEVFAQLTGGGDVFGFPTDDNWLAGLSVKGKPLPELSVTSHLYFGEREGFANGYFEALVTYNPNFEWSLNLDGYMGWLSVDDLPGTRRMDQWGSVLLYATYLKQVAPWAAVLTTGRLEYLHTETNEELFGMTLAAKVEFFEIVNFGLEFRTDRLGDGNWQGTVAGQLGARYAF